MSVTQLVNLLLRAAPQADQLGHLAKHVVGALLGDGPLVETPVLEASVHRPQRGRVWVAAYTGPQGGQIWRSTGLTDHDQALLVAKKWEREARAERSKLGRTPRKPLIRVRRSEPFAGSGPLTQQEVAMLLNISERAVREIERRAIQKLRSHPLLRQVWQRYLSGKLHEYRTVLTSEEIQALCNLVRTMEERFVVAKVLRLIQMLP